MYSGFKLVKKMIFIPISGCHELYTLCYNIIKNLKNLPLKNYIHYRHNHYVMKYYAGW